MENQDKTSIRPPVRPEGVGAGAEAREERAKSHKRLLIAFVLLLALLGGAAGFVTYGMELWGGRSVPRVISDTRERATAKLQEAGFVVEVQEQVVDESVNHVIEQTPAADERLEEGSTVTIVVGVARTVPAVVGLPVEQAQQLLADAGATNVQVSYQPTTEGLGQVLAVNPNEGTAFVSSDAITLTVASAVVVPDVLGLDETSARSQIEALGIDVVVNYVKSEEERRRVLAMEPPAGTDVAGVSEVALTVSSPYPSDVRALAEYFDCRPVDVATFLAQQGFSCKGGYLDGRGNANALYSNGSTNIRLCSDPFDHTFDAATGFTQLDSEAGQVNVDATGGSGDLGDVVAQGVDFRGVRYEFAPSEITGAARSISMEGVRAVMQQCGLEGNKGSCTESSIILPSGQQDLAKRDGRRFICAYGTEDSYTWTVLIAQTAQGSNDVRVVVTYAPTDLYSFYDLSRNGNRVSDFVAFVDMYVLGYIPGGSQGVVQDGQGGAATEAQATEQAQN